MGKSPGASVESAVRRYGHPSFWFCGIAVCCYLIGGCDFTPNCDTAKTASILDIPLVPMESIEVVAPSPVAEPVPAAQAAPAPEPEFRMINVRVSGYCPCAKCCSRMTGLTATQSTAWVPGLAADFSWLPPGTQVSVPGYGKATVDDTGGKMKRKYWHGVPRIDARFTYHWQARDWGIQYLQCKVFK